MRNQGLNLSKVVKEARRAHKLRYSQTELGNLLGLNGQVISNLERGLSSIAVKHVIKISKILDVDLERLKRAMVQDYEDALNREIWKTLDDPLFNATDRLRKTAKESGGSLPGSRVHDPAMQGRGGQRVSGSNAERVSAPDLRVSLSDR